MSEEINSKSETKAYSLTRVESGEFGLLDQDECSWNTVEDWLFIGILGGCGCGSSEEFGKAAVSLLEFFATDILERKGSIYENDGFRELLAHWFDSKDLIEHGSSINGSWLTDKGKQIYAAIKANKFMRLLRK